VVRVGVEARRLPGRRARARAAGERAIDELQDPRGGLVEDRLVELAGADGGD
jgi:hypothetical protein